MEKVALLLSTYNGERYIEALLASLVNQSYQDFVLYIRDDGSTDQTPQILATFCQRYEHFLFVNEGEKENLGVIQSFSYLVEIALTNEEIGYLMFVDQDDIWLPEKIEYSLEQIQQMEQENGEKTPLLFHTDLQVVDENLEVLCDSFWKYQKINPARCAFHQLLVQNNVTGCSMIINRSLAEMILPIPIGAIMHDRWIALVAAAFGKIGWSEKTTIQYRQHSHNSVGAKKPSVSNMYKKINEPSVIGKTIVQAEAFLEKYKDALSDQNKIILEQYISLKTASRWKRLKIVHQHRFYKNGWLRNLGMFYLLSMKKDL